MENLYKVIWWNEMEQGYTVSEVNEQGLVYLIESVGEESFFSVEEM